jgi:hypothetical protein
MLKIQCLWFSNATGCIGYNHCKQLQIYLSLRVSFDHSGTFCVLKGLNMNYAFIFSATKFPWLLSLQQKELTSLLKQVLTCMWMSRWFIGACLKYAKPQFTMSKAQITSSAHLIKKVCSIS